MKNRKLTRLKYWDYGSDGYYFITICTKDMTHYFGEVVDGEMILSPVGIIANLLWYEIKNHADNIKLGEFIVMPNHIHGILILENNTNTVEMRHASPLQNTISSIIGSYKAAVSKHAHRLGFDFIWQRNFYDHVIRDEASNSKISEYIVNNPIKWEEDRFYDVGVRHA